MYSHAPAHAIILYKIYILVYDDIGYNRIDLSSKKIFIFNLYTYLLFKKISKIYGT